MEAYFVSDSVAEQLVHCPESSGQDDAAVGHLYHSLLALGQIFHRDVVAEVLAAYVFVSRGDLALAAEPDGEYAYYLTAR